MSDHPLCWLPKTCRTSRPGLYHYGNFALGCKPGGFGIGCPEVGFPVWIGRPLSFIPGPLAVILN